ncbi:rhodanese-like domain-containing protein [Actinomycetes bacterium NPDC127524]|jgi:rhodanese-related sulfurtransferase|uniref:rhodanese-like domain-containing protein n=1 Tax=Bacillaceae TaxID=186817 RepID=UPI0008EB37BD|nr:MULTISPECIES: rhodanese-like domain-containing protein [unclassified Bacillus (in: firmicutes)]OIK13773.1 rhodanese-like domain-containing protein [Bacillus sp. MUM 13]SFC41082.1 Rhodanese-related sulfurtransferase [Bacillus sp. OV322]
MGLYILIVIAAAVIVYSAFNWFNQRRIVKTLSQDEFVAGYRKAQLIDVRETSEYDNGHILGARNIPLTQMKPRLKELRPDKPVYLYCQSGLRSARAAQLLHKKGYKELYHLKGGFKQWSGKIKSNN